MENLEQNKAKVFTQGKILLISGIPFYVNQVFPKTNSIVISMIGEDQWQALQEKAHKMKGQIIPVEGEVETD